ncbi:GH92 family glycosyl hydrolase [Cellulosimicrobium arenosum]|uniref:GH92 family glycosyl hydrolase n=1 Tax=Cellulosimicrobium arenosum TaxID=2708133 RepID=A0A927J0K3_9MICO|nr:GH92 family glycosyl hydrolase [Cellulosimicrobium arenosum]MBD8079658.1 GH92 family glycosyl hydrolase [Cellulosimicrobium arenosum]
MRSLPTALTATLLGTALVAVGLPATAAPPGSAGTGTAAAPSGSDLSQEVNPFVGTEDEGNAYPGATVPFGMVQLSPDNTNTYGSTSYSNDAGRVWGFSHRHVNSAGCPAAGELLVTPDTSEAPRTTRDFIDIEDGTEHASAGFYEATLANDVHAELTATTRVGLHRYTFPASTTSHLSFNVGQTLRDAGASDVTWVDDHTLEGWVDNGGFCGGTPDEQRYFFSATFDRPAASTGTWGEDGEYVAGSAQSESDSGDNGAVAVFDTTQDQDVEVAVGVSFVDVEGARANREAEATDDDGTQVAFDTVREQARDAWNTELGRVEIEASADQRRVFYTQLYKTLLSPTIGSDVDGRYRGTDLAVHATDGWDYYQTFSLWDTYRTQATLHALLVPDRAQDIVRSMYQHRVEGGWLPRWSLGALETNIMAGDPVTPWIAENFALGTVPDDISDELWDYLVENATTTPPDDVESVGRQSVEFYEENGHIPFYPENEGGLGGQFEEYRHGGSATMEFALADASVGAAAQRTGRTEDVSAFLAKGRNWQNLWNPDVELSGGFQGMVNAKRPTGEFATLPELTDVTRSGFHEGVPWQYQWMAPQDVPGLVDAMGGEDGFVERLDYYFDQDALAAEPGVSPDAWADGGSAYYTTIHYNPGNEPTIGNAWLYGFVGQPWKTNDVLAANLNRFPDSPHGGVGNDDLGTLGAWYVMAALGFQPVEPGSGILALNAPKVQSATVTPDGGAPFSISAEGANEKLPSYVAGVTVDGADHTAAWLDVSALQGGGSLDFDLSDSSEGLTWGTAPADRIPSVSAEDAATPSVDVQASTRCLAGTAYVAVRATNTGDVPADVTLSTPFGSRTFADVAPGRNAYQSFSVRADAVDAGVATVTATPAGGVPTTVQARYDALGC